METEKLGEIVVNGKNIDLDNSTVETLDNILVEMNSQKENIINEINTILSEIQN